MLNLQQNTDVIGQQSAICPQMRSYIEDMLQQLGHLAATNGLSEMSSLINVTHQAVMLGSFDQPD